jgi:hypothetical protein
MIAFYLSVAVLGGFCLWLYFKVGPRQAVAAAALLTLLVPQWVRWDVDSGVWINVPTAVTVLTLAIYSFHPQATFNFRLGPCDWAILAMIGVHIASDVVNDGFSISILLRAYGEWFMPYVAGRLAFQRIDDVRWALPLAAGVSLVLAMQGVVEAILSLRPNLFEFVAMQERPVPKGIESNAANASRWGFKRAYGPLMHSLYFGVVQVILMPWLLYAGQRMMRNRTDEPGGKGWLWSIPVTAVGVASSLSRGPFLAIGALLYGMFWVLAPRTRVVLGVIGVVAVLAMIAISGPLLNQLDALTGEDLAGQTTKSADGEVKFTSAGARKLLFTIYAHPMKHAGLLGYGTNACSSFPPDVPLNEPVGRVKSVDNAYILFTLRFGYLGLLMFLAINVTAAWQFLSLADTATGDLRVWLAAMAGMVVTAMLMFMLVWMPQDVGFIYLFSLGASSGLVLDPKTPAKEGKQRRRRSVTREPEEPPMRPIGDAW